MNWKRSEDLFQQALKLMPGGVNSPVRAFRSVGGNPFFTERAEGCMLTTVDGHQLIDFVGTWGPAIHGHNHPRIRSKVAEALDKGTSFGTPNPYEIQLAQRVIDWVPSVEKVRLCNSGTEATMSCIRLARGATKRSKIIKFEGCYHGHVDSLLVKAGSGALTLGHPDSAGIPAGFAAETIVLPYNDLAALEAAFKANPEQIAGIIVEPYPANCGLILPDAGYLEGLRELCSQNGSLLIFDEVMTGFRLARGGVQELTGVTPDLTAMGKVIGGGLPVGALGGKAELMDLLAPLGPVYQAGTLSGNPLAMAAGIAALDLLEETDPYADMDRKGQRIRNALLDAAKAKGIPLQLPQAGSMFCLFFSETAVRSGAEATASSVNLFPKLFRHALENGVFLPPSAYETCFIATAHDDATIDQAAEVLSEGIRRL
ncbi:MAG: glutamate-1-semialdehyde 2,1-aminomutase [Opitutales bacterium]|nr:glutamate-1-semialdehyde 2,1-aminomutase [Opitutales bacterium]